MSTTETVTSSQVVVTSEPTVTSTTDAVTSSEPVLTSTKAETTSEAVKVTTQNTGNATTSTGQLNSTAMPSTTEKVQVSTTTRAVITEVVVTTKNNAVCYYLGRVIPEGQTVLIVPCTKVTCEKGGRNSQVINIDVGCSGRMIQSSILWTMLALIFFLVFGNR